MRLFILGGTHDRRFGKGICQPSCDGKSATYFNRTVMSSQAFLRIKSWELENQMEWLANGLQEAAPEVLEESDAFGCAIYHLRDGLWVLPSFKELSGRGSLTHFAKGADQKSARKDGPNGPHADGLETAIRSSAPGQKSSRGRRLHQGESSPKIVGTSSETVGWIAITRV